MAIPPSEAMNLVSPAVPFPRSTLNTEKFNNELSEKDSTANE
jgi:hypothetical protein